MKRSVYIWFIGMFLLFNFTFGQDCDSGYVWLEIPSSWVGGIDSTNCFYENHINIIQNLIDNNLESLDSIMDSNDDGVIEPLEFGGFGENFMGEFHNPKTQWSDGKLVSLFCEGSCGLSYLPENICDIINDTPFEYYGMWDQGFIFNDNNICPPIPTCIESYDPYDESVNIGFGFQDCLDCETFGSNYSYIDFDTIEGIDEVYNQYIFFYHQSNTNCYSQSEIDFLDEIINTNSSLELIVWFFSWGFTESVSGIHPLQLGGQIWENGRLKEIHWGEIEGEPGWFSLSISHIPESIQNLEVLEKLNLSRNFLDSIPSSIVYLDNLIELNLSNNNLTGEIPPEIGDLTNLTTLKLYSNQLIGEIPPEIGDLTNLTELLLFDNQLTGSIPSEIGTLTNLNRLYLYNNQLTGEIPPEIGNFTNLTNLRLHNNQLTGEIPEEICNQGDTSPELENNNLCPPYPDCISYQEIVPQNSSECEYVCEVGVEIDLWGVCINIEETTELNFWNNGLTGEIPPEIGNLTNLEELNLSSNDLTGEIPPEICNVNYVDVSNNKLCPPYLDCGEGPITSEEEQDTSNCEDLSNSDIYPFNYSLNKPYPNPFNPSTTISFSVPLFDRVSIEVYDLKGSLVTTLVDKYYHSGNHIINWDGSNYSSGNYIVKMKSNNYESSQIITLVK